MTFGECIVRQRDMVASGPDIETGSFASPQWLLCPPSSVKVVCWNINRGLQLPRIIEFLSRSKADILLLQEADLNARRTHHLNIAREIAQKLQLNYVFGREFQELTQGTRHSPAYHGQATLSRWPLSNARILRLQQQSNFWQPHWFCQRSNHSRKGSEVGWHSLSMRMWGRKQLLPTTYISRAEVTTGSEGLK